ncbi:hypothetical protein AB205_0190210, partial [Aquarana catesbeiana]
MLCIQILSHLKVPRSRSGRSWGVIYNWKTSRKTSMMLFQKIKTSLMFWGEF